MFGHPGKKLLFMGNEFGQEAEWNHDRSLDWHLLDRADHAGIQKLIRDLNRLYRSLPAMHERDCEVDGFEWLTVDDTERSVFAWLRKGRDQRAKCLVVVNFNPQVYRGYRIKVPLAGVWREALNTDAAIYGGGNVGNNGAVTTIDKGHVSEVELVIPPLAAVFFVPE
jgi:1,4-alpha-glucan branching enzyme